MYRIRRADGVEEGPHPIGVLQLWMRTGRVTASTPARQEGDTLWRPLGEFPPFAGSPASGPPPLPTPPVRPPPPPSGTGRTRTSRLAVAALVCGSLGIFVIPGIAGVILGLAALARIRNSREELKGRSLAVTGVILGMTLAIVSIVLGMLATGNAQRQWQQQVAQRNMARRGQQADPCLQSLNALGLSLRQYASDHADLLPGSTNWCDAVREYVPSLDAFQCLGRPGPPGSAFALNSAVADRNLDELDPQTVLLFELETDWNGTGGAERASEASRRKGMVLVYLAGGEIRRVRSQEVPVLRWTP